MPSRIIALGIEDYLGDFARRNFAETWEQFARSDPMNWKAHFFALMSDPGVEVLFNLKGVDVWAGVTRAAAGRGGATDWELLQIRVNVEWWPRISWSLDGASAPNPFE
jgi:hypothetical protein